MPPREVSTSFKFAGGVSTKLDSKTVPTTKVLVLENGVFTKGISIKKRFGYEDLGQTIEGSISEVTGGIRTAVRDDTEILQFTSNRAYSRETGTSQWSDTGAVYSAVATDRPLVATGTQQTQPDLATNGGVTVSAWEDSSGGVWWSATDATTGRIYRAATQADADGISPRCVAVGDNLHVYYVVAATRSIYVVVVNPLVPGAAVTPIQMVSDLDSTDSIYDACATGRTATPAAIAWFEHGTTNIRLGYVDQSGSIGTPLLGEPSSVTFAAGRSTGSPLAISFVDVDGADADRIALCYINSVPNGAIHWFSGGDVGSGTFITNLSGGNVYVSTDVQRIAMSVVQDTDAGTIRAWMAFEEANAAPSKRLTAIGSAEITSGPDAAITTIRSVGLFSKAFTVDSDVFAVFVHDTTFFNTYLTFKISNASTDGFVPIGRHLPAEAAGAPPHKHLVSAHVDGDVVTLALSRRERLASENNDLFRETSTRLLRLDFASDLSHQAVTFGKGLYMAGACPMHYDGDRWNELGFSVGPELITAVTATGGSLTSGTTYLYRAWYEWTDGQGEVHQGPVSAGTLVTMGGSDTKVTLTLPTCRITRKPGVRIMVARSRAAATGSTAQLFRITSLDAATAGSDNGYVPNSTSADTATLVDVMSDDDLETFDEIYTDGGVLSNDPAPLGATIWRSRDRLFASDPSDPSMVRYTQPLGDAGLAVRWPPDLFLRVDPQRGAVMAGAARDNRYVVWTERGIFSFAGDGPDETGSSAETGFSAVQTVPSDVGCSDPQSIVLTPQAFLFGTDRGIWALTSDFNVGYIGAPVEGFNDQTIRRGMPMPGRTQVVFLTDSGSTLLYDYLFDQWSTFTNHEGHDCAVANGQFHYLRSDGRFWRETVGSYSDAGTRITLRIETAWIHMQEQLQGFEKFFYAHILGTWTSEHQLGVSYQTDYTHGWTDAVWFDGTGASSSTGWITGSNTVGLEPITGTEYGDGEYGDGPYGGTGPGEYAWRLDLYETGQSIQLRFEDFEADGFFGPSFELTELLIAGQVLGNARRPMTAGRSG